MASTSPADLDTNPTPIWVHVLKWGALALVAAAAFVVATRLADQGNVLLVVLTAFVAMAILAVYATTDPLN